MNKKILSLPWMAKKTKKKNCYNVKACLVDNYLVVDIVGKTPFFRTVISEKSYENYFPEAVKLGDGYSTTTIAEGVNGRSWDNMFDYRADRFLEQFNADEESEKIIIDFCGKPGYSYQRRPIWCTSLMEKERRIATDKQNAAYSNHYKKLAEFTKQIKETPKSFHNWCERMITKHFVYVNPFKGSKTTTGICSACESTIEIKKGETIKRCPVCGKKVEMTRKSKLDFSQKDFILLQKNGNLLLERHYEAEYSVQFNCNSGVSAYEGFRIWEKGLKAIDLQTKESKTLFRKFDPWTHKNFWDDKNLYSMNPIRLFPGITKGLSILKDEPMFKYSGIEYLPECDPFDYLSRYVRMPQLEMLAKLGLTNLARTINEFNMADTYNKPWQMLKVTKEGFNRMRKMNATVTELKWFQYESEKGIRIADEDIVFFSDRNLSPMSFNFILDKMTFKQIRNYLEKQYSYNGYDVIGKWRDYIDMAVKFKKDMTLELNYKPKNVFVAHDELASIEIAENREKEILEMFPETNEIISSLAKYQFSDKNYSIVVPKDIKDIVREGRILGHCLDRTDIYFDRINRHESFIFFLRKNSDIEAPFYTLEVEPDGTTRQKRTFGDRQDKDYQDCVAFIKKWQRHLKSVLSKKDMADAKVSAQLREENFKDLRKRNEKVWHGLLAGQLLADVLEADLLLA